VREEQAEVERGSNEDVVTEVAIATVLLSLLLVLLASKTLPPLFPPATEK